MILLLKASIVILSLLAFYKLLLEKESFFYANRLYLLGCLALACVLPFVVLPQMMENQGYIDVLVSNIQASEVHEIDNDLSLIDVPQKESDVLPTSDKNIQQEEVASNEIDPAIIDEFEMPTEADSDIQESTIGTKGIMFWIFILYLFGVGILTFRLLGQLMSIVLKIIKNTDRIVDDGYTIVNIEEEIEPCSFFNYIFINPTLYDFETYEQIIAHEKVHVTKRHSVDLLLSEIAVIVLWFNPFVWLLRVEVEKNIEYQTDNYLVNMESGIKEMYQMNLVKIACNTAPLSITTNYNQSLIKQRIIKMNTKRSNLFNYWKYAFCMPLVFILALLLNKPYEGFAQSADNTLSLIDIPMEMDDLPISSEESPAPDPIEDEPSNEPLEMESLNKSASIISEPKKEILYDSKLIADCEAFEKAVAEGDLELVKEILKTLDPDCLKVKNNNSSNLKSLNTLVKNKETQLQQQSTETSKYEESSCARIRIARDESNELKVKNILMNEDVSCILDIYGKPSRDLHIIRDQLKYGANLSIDYKGVINISEIGFYIETSNADAKSCQDPNYKRLESAIHNKDATEIYKILSGELLTCPLNVDGKTNDFIFLKEIAKFTPRISFHNSNAITIHSTGFAIDIDKMIDKPDNYGVSYDEDPVGYYEQAQLLEEIQSRIQEISINHKNASCLDLINAVKLEKYSLVKNLLMHLNTECFHRETTTITSDDDVLTVSKVTTPLTAAIRQNNLRLTTLFVEHGVDLNYAGDDIETPLIIAVKSGSEAIVKLLVENGADLNRRDKANFTALYYAKYKSFGGIYDYLKSKGAK